MSETPGPVAAPIIVTALLGAADFAFFDALRRRHFPPERNDIAAHLTMFHHLAPSLEADIRRRLDGLTRGNPAPHARVTGLFSLGRGTAFRVEAPELSAIRATLVDAFRTTLIPQDLAPWRAHITVQNKVAPADAKALADQLAAEFVPREIAIIGLAAWHYRGGPWTPISRHLFKLSKGG